MANINGTNKGDRINGTAQSDYIDGRQGDDFLFGGAGDDFLFGGVGRDSLDGGDGDDYLDGGNGGDELTGGAGNDTIVGGNAGDVAIYSGLSTDYSVELGPVAGSYIVTDLRPGSPDGTDLVTGISFAGFIDGTFRPEDLVGQTPPPPPNRAPVANADAVIAAEDGATTLNVLGNDTDADGDSLSVVSLDMTGASGTASINPDGTIAYTPAAGAQALQAGETMTDSFTYTIRDGDLATSTATVTVTVVGAADAPEAANDAVTVAEDDGAVNVTALLLANDTDPDAGDALQVTGVQAVSQKGASVSVSSNGQVIYNPGGVFSYLEQGETATDTFTYTVTDSTGLTSTATATVTVTGVSQEADAYFFVREDETSEDMLGSILEYMGIEPVAVETEGLLGTLDFDPVAGGLFFTADHDSSDRLNFDQQQTTFFTVVGTEGERKVIGMIIDGVNDDIVAVDDAIAIGEGQTSGNLWSALISNEIDPDNAASARQILSVDTSGTAGAVAFDAATRTVTYSAAGIELAPGETITDSFTYTVTDGVSRSIPDTATVTVTVTGAEDGSVSVSMSKESGVDSILSAFLPDGQADAAGAFETIPAAQLDMAVGLEWQMI